MPSLPAPRLPWLARLLLPVGLCACEALEPPVEEQPPADLVLRHVVVDHTVRGERRAKVRFDELRYHRDQARVEGDRLVFQPVRDGVTEGTLEAKHAFLTTRDGQGLAKGDVRYRSNTGDSLETPMLGLDLAREKAWGNDGVTVRGEGYELKSPRFRVVWDDVPKVQFEGGVTSIVRQPAKPVAKAAKKPGKKAAKPRAGAGR